MKKYYYIGFILVLSILSIYIYYSYYQTEIKYLKTKTEHLKLSLKNIKDIYLIIIDRQKKTIQKLEKEVQRQQIVTVSFYHPESRGINSDSDPTNTATMTKPIVGRTIACSNELFEIGWLWSKIYVEGFGVFRVEDRMDPGVKGKCIDICVSSEKRAFQLGKKHNVIAVRLF